MKHGITLTTPAASLPALLDRPDDEFTAWLQERDQPRMRLRQIRRWLLQGERDRLIA